MENKKPYIKVTKNGPYLAYGITTVDEKIILTDGEGFSVAYGDGQTFQINTFPVALCRCGLTKNAPFCDGTHIKSAFDGTETASFEKIEDNAFTLEGPNLTLKDKEGYCAFARFCDVAGRVWNLVTVGDKQTDKQAIQEACACPAGRLMIFDKEGKMIENAYAPCISVLEDSGLKISGPLWVKGFIRVESGDGKSYEIRNRQTLCRCGRSGNKPFCDGTHASVRFRSKPASIKKR
jgi:CDGSH-type Zn-finger protein